MRRVSKCFFRLIFLCGRQERNPDGIWPTQREVNPIENIFQDLWVYLVCLGYRSFSQSWFHDSDRQKPVQPLLSSDSTCSEIPWSTRKKATFASISVNFN